MVKKITCFLPLLWSFSGYSSVDIESELQSCSLLHDDARRLACYDEVYSSISPAESVASDFGVHGHWWVYKEDSPIDDSVNVFMSLSAIDEIPDGYGKSVTPMLHIRCKENTTALYISWDRFIGSGEAYITYRIDKNKAQRQFWSISTDHQATGKWRGGSSIPFIKKLLDSKSLLVNVTPYGDNPVLVNFDVSGIESAIKPLREECRW